MVPAKTNSRINCFRQWEQAFRMYVTLYCTKHPQQAREIWQYVSVINTTSMSYNWDNVYNYDMVFRQLMEFYPNRSWAVTYNQMGNLSMTNPINSGSGSNQQQRRSFGFQNNTNVSAQNTLKKKLDYCWSFKKGVKCKFGRKCEFTERCSYCDSPSHRVVNCEKLNKRDGQTPRSVSGGGNRKVKSR